MVVIEECDGCIYEYFECVVYFSCGVAMMFGLFVDDVEWIVYVVFLYDVGKFVILVEIFDKNGLFMCEEWYVMVEYLVVGECILMCMKDFSGFVLIVCYEHEYWDGIGYFDGFFGICILFGACVIFVCDVYIVMTVSCFYCDVLYFDEVVVELRVGVGSKFDFEVVDVLLDLLGYNVFDVLDCVSYVKLVVLSLCEFIGWWGVLLGWVLGA